MAAARVPAPCGAATGDLPIQFQRSMPDAAGRVRAIQQALDDLDDLSIGTAALGDPRVGAGAVESRQGGRALRIDPDAVWSGLAPSSSLTLATGYLDNRNLLWHEQFEVIGRYDDQVRDRGPVTWGITMGMSLVAHSPVPGGRPFRDVVPYRVNLDIPDRVPVVPSWLLPERVPIVGIEVPGGRGVYVDTPGEIGLVDLPINNVSIFEHRWQWIDEDMLPAWLDHVDAGTAADLAAEPIPDQGARQRLIPDWLLTYEPEGS